MADGILKLCLHCKTEKPLDLMCKTAASKDGYRSLCKECNNAYYRKRRIEKYEQVRSYERKFHRERRLRYEFGMTVEQYDAMLREQDNKCAICGCEPSYERHAVDHCHETGTVRGLLCGNCNKALGLFKDSPDLLKAAATYLRRAKSSRHLHNTANSPLAAKWRKSAGRSGVEGVRVEGTAFVAVLTVGGIDRRVGRFRTIEEAAAARAAAEREYALR